MKNTMDQHQAELEVLGRILKDPDLIYSVNNQISGEDFLIENNRTIYEGMRACSISNKPIEIGTLYNELRGSNITISDLTNLVNCVASTSDIKHYTAIVKENSRRRNLKLILEGSLNNIQDKTSEEIAQHIIKQLYSLSEDRSSSTYMNRTEMMEAALAYLQEGIVTKGENVGMKTGWKSLDIPLSGFKKGDLVIIGARPSVGKTAFTLNLANKLTDKYKVLFFELEMSAIKIALREVSARSLIPMNKFSEPHMMSESEISSFMRAADHLSKKGNLILDDKARAPLDYIRNRVHYLKNTHNVDLVVIDHIGLIPQPKGVASRNEWLGEISATLKGIAKEFDVCVIGLSQLNRSVESRSDKRPMLSDLRDSGNIEQDADQVIFLYREGYYIKENVPDNERFEVIIAKNRDGITGTVYMVMNTKKQLVTEIYEGK